MASTYSIASQYELTDYRVEKFSASVRIPARLTLRDNHFMAVYITVRRSRYYNISNGQPGCMDTWPKVSSLSLPLSLPPSPSHTHTRARARAHTHTLTHSLSHTHTGRRRATGAHLDSACASMSARRGRLKRNHLVVCNRPHFGEIVAAWWWTRAAAADYQDRTSRCNFIRFLIDQ